MILEIVYMQATVGVAAAVAGATALVAGVTSAAINNKKKKDSAEESAEYEAQAKAMRANRQPVLNQANDIRALAAQVSNPYENLAVSTAAAEFEAEQTDMALANTLDAMTSSGASAGGAIYENTDDITADYTITSGSNGMSVGPMTIASGVTVTVPSGQRWVIL